MFSDPTIPDRTEAFLAGDNRARDRLVSGVRLLATAGCALIAVPCNSAHIWFEDIQNAVPVKVLNIVDEAVKAIANERISGARVGMLATVATTNSGLYQNRLLQTGYELMADSDPRVREKVNRGIHLLKAGRPNEGARQIADAAHNLVDLGAEGLLIACTDISPVSKMLGPELRVPIIDSTESIASAAVGLLSRMQ